jgi:phosphoribosyl-ATP pyrophosphohydrolase/phosphoribosyl-AMP cyclohydrolase
VSDLSFLTQLEAIIRQRISDNPADSSTARLAALGLTKVAQKLGEEGVEVALAAATESEQRLRDECADLIYHMLLLLSLRDLSLADVVAELEARHLKPKP